jgi:hypothetical protein
MAPIISITSTISNVSASRDSNTAEDAPRVVMIDDLVHVSYKLRGVHVSGEQSEHANEAMTNDTYTDIALHDDYS